MCEIRSYLNRGTLDRLSHRRNEWFLRRWWKIGDPGNQTYKSLQNLIVLWGRWLGKRFYIIANCILIVQTQYLSYRLQLILQTDYTMTLVVYYSYTLTTNLRLWLTTYRRNQINFVFFVLSATLILRGPWVWSWRKLQSWGFLHH